METTFPVGGPRQPVYDWLESYGFTMSKHSDKTWTHPDGFEVQVYGTGSCARISLDGKVIADGPIIDAFHEAKI